jgi:hypothetical protein
MNEAERTANNMIRRYGTREAAIQAHVCDVEAMTDEDFLARRVGRASSVRVSQGG